MPRYDIPERTGTVVSVFRDGRERSFPLPYDTEDPADIEILERHPEVIVVPKPKASATKPVPAAEAEPEKEV